MISTREEPLARRLMGRPLCWASGEICAAGKLLHRHLTEKPGLSEVRIWQRTSVEKFCGYQRERNGLHIKFRMLDFLFSLLILFPIPNKQTKENTSSGTGEMAQ